jgi:hypothetical protein
LIVADEEPKVIPLRTGVEEMVGDLIITAMRMEDELGLLPPVAFARLPELAPGHEYWVRWRHQRRRQRILVEQVLPDAKLPVLRFRIPRRGRHGPAHYLRLRDPADFGPALPRVRPKL